MILRQRESKEQREGLQQFIDDLPIGLVMAEIGCFGGESTEMFLQSGKIDKLYAVDPWSQKYTRKCSMKEVEQAFDAVQSHYPDKVVKLKGTINDVMDKLPELDFAYIDGDHSYEAVKNDIEKVLKKLKYRGFISGHDFGIKKIGVEQAVKELETPYNVYPDTSWVCWNPKKEKRIKTFIINFNRVTLPSRLADWCRANGLDVIIIDNASTNPDTLTYYKNCEYPVIHMKKNHGSHVVWEWESEILDVFGIDGTYIVTDPDLDLRKVPHDFLEVMLTGLIKHPKAVKCGLSLEINNLPGTEQGRFMERREAEYWQKPLDDMYYDAPTASTFALYRAGVKKWQLKPSIRTNRPYTAKHVPWYYTDFNSLPEDEKYYYNTTNDRWATGKERIKEL